MFEGFPTLCLLLVLIVMGHQPAVGSTAVAYHHSNEKPHEAHDSQAKNSWTQLAVQVYSPPDKTKRNRLDWYPFATVLSKGEDYGQLIQIVQTTMCDAARYKAENTTSGNYRLYGDAASNMLDDLRKVAKPFIRDSDETTPEIKPTYNPDGAYDFGLIRVGDRLIDCTVKPAKVIDTMAARQTEKRAETKTLRKKGNQIALKAPLESFIQVQPSPMASSVAAREFPNYFAEFCDSYEEGLELLEKAIASVLSRLRLPYTTKDKDGKTTLQQEKFFSQLVELAGKETRVYVGGGVVRSIIGYIHQEIYNVLKGVNDVPITTKGALGRIILSNDKLSAIDALGIGSDLDIYYEVQIDKDNPALLEEREQSVSALLRQHCNSAAKYLELDGHTVDSIRDSLSPHGDLHEAKKGGHFNRGGSTMDMFRFDLYSSKLVQPEYSHNLVRLLFCGYFEYLPTTANYTESPSFTDNVNKAFRAIRVLLELPFLQLPLGSYNRLVKILTSIRDGLATETRELSELHIELIHKAVRNARHGGAHNRLYRDSDELTQLIMEITRLQEPSTALFPEFIAGLPLDKPKPLIPEDTEKGFIDVGTFVAEHTDNGKLYHGARSLENIIPMVRNSGHFVVYSKPMVSKDSPLQRLTAFGRSFYTTREFESAQSHAGYSGVVFEFTVALDARLRIVKWDWLKKTKFGQHLIEEAGNNGMNIYELLAEKLQVDIVVGEGHVLIQNPTALKIPTGISVLMTILRGLVKSQGVVDRRKVACQILRYSSFCQLTKMLGFSEAASPHELIKAQQVEEEMMPLLLFRVYRRFPDSSVKQHFSQAVMPLKRVSSNVYNALVEGLISRENMPFAVSELCKIAENWLKEKELGGIKKLVKGYFEHELEMEENKLDVLVAAVPLCHYEDKGNMVFSTLDRLPDQGMAVMWSERFMGAIFDSSVPEEVREEARDRMFDMMFEKEQLMRSTTGWKEALNKVAKDGKSYIFPVVYRASIMGLMNMPEFFIDQNADGNDRKLWREIEKLDEEHRLRSSLLVEVAKWSVDFRKEYVAVALRWSGKLSIEAVQKMVQTRLQDSYLVVLWATIFYGTWSIWDVEEAYWEEVQNTFQPARSESKRAMSVVRTLLENSRNAIPTSAYKHLILQFGTEVVDSLDWARKIPRETYLSITGNLENDKHCQELVLKKMHNATVKKRDISSDEEE